MDNHGNSTDRSWGLAYGNLLVFAAVPVFILTYRRLPLSDLSYLLLAIFLALHAIGAHYTYAKVPLGDWMKEALAWDRNHFDRLVHCLFGLLLLAPVREVLMRTVHASRILVLRASLHR